MDKRGKLVPIAAFFAAAALFFSLAGLFAADRAGSRVLSRYGYTGGVSFTSASDYAVIICLAVVFAALLTFAFRVFTAWDARKRARRVCGLTEYLLRINSGDYTLRPDINEDELSRLEDEIYKTVSLLREGRESAQAEKERLAGNLSDIAHQIKTPLASITLMSDLLSAEATGKQAEYVSRISAQAERLNTLVSSLLTLSRLDAGTLVFESKPVDTRELFYSVGDALIPLLESKDQTLSLSGDGFTFNGDFHWASQAFINLIRNASEHSPEGSQISVRFEGNPVCQTVSVEDCGRGIPPEDLPRLFTRFYRGKDAGRDGVGIGLSLAKAVIEGQNGEITAANKPEGGAVFTVKFYY